ncbi:MAG: inner membrane protein YpjD, partial [Psychromonas sp.]
MDNFALLATIFYMLSGGLAVNILFNRAKPFYKWFIGSSLIALTAHAMWLYENIFLIDGQNLPMLNVVSLIGFVIALLSVLVSKSLNTGVLSPIVSGFNIINFIAVVYLPSHYITHLDKQPAIGSHIIFALLA